MDDRNKSGEIPVSGHGGVAVVDEASSYTSEQMRKFIDTMTPAQRRFYVSPAGTRTPAPMVNKTTREIPAETLAFLKECCK